MSILNKLSTNEIELLASFYKLIDEKSNGLIPMRLILNYTMACPLSCDFCCYGCHPNRKEKMPIELASKLILEASEIELIDSVSFTGGEPMLFLDDIFYLSSILKSVELPFTITTAGHWGRDRVEVERIISMLKSNGLSGINISFDPSHNEFVNKECILNIADVSSELDLITTIVGTFYDLNDNLNIHLPSLKPKLNVTFSNHYVSKVGRARNKDISQEKYNIEYGLDDFICPRNTDNDLVIFYDGKAYPCCSVFNRSTPGIMLGNANEDSLTNLINIAYGLYKFQILKRNRFSYIYSLIKELDSDLYDNLPNPLEHTSACSLCNAIYKNKTLTTKLNSIFYSKDLDLLRVILSKIDTIVTPNFSTRS